MILMVYLFLEIMTMIHTYQIISWQFAKICQIPATSVPTFLRFANLMKFINDENYN